MAKHRTPNSADAGSSPALPAIPLHKKGYRKREPAIENPALRKHYRAIREWKRFLNVMRLDYIAFKKWQAERERVEKSKRENPTLYN